MADIDDNTIEYSLVSITSIDEDTYNVLKKSVDSGDVIEPNNIQNESQLEESINENDYIQQLYPEIECPTLSFVIESKIKEMRSKCRQVIINGIDITLQSGAIEHFDLTIEDQMNLNSLRYYLIANDLLEFPYHCKEGEFKYYSKNDVLKILIAMDDHILYHNSYFNSLKKYINSLTSYNEINAIQYGDIIPLHYKSNILIDLENKLI